jgi:hypothetical protein
MRVLMIVLFMLLVSSVVRSQENWDTPFIKVGDSSLSTPPGSKVILTGKITDINGNPLASSSISADGFKYFDYTDASGNYLLEMPSGKYRITIRFVGKETAFRRIMLFSAGNLNFTLEESIKTLEEVVISSRPLDNNVKSALAGSNTLNIKEIKKLPTFLGEVDVLKSIQLLPGVSTIGEGSSGFNVRGGRADQNQILLNGTPVFNSSHALGFVSSFNPDVISNFTLYKGNVPSNLGGRASSVLEVNTRSGSYDSWKHQIGLGVASVRLTSEGPLIKDKSSILLSARFSNANWILKSVDNPDVSKSRLNFNDVTAAISHEFTKNSVLRLNYFRSYDFFRFSDQFAYDYTNQIASLEWKTLTNRKISPSTLVSLSNFTNALIDPSGFDASRLNNQIKYFQIKETVSYIPIEKLSILMGFEAILYDSRPEEFGNYGSNITIEPKVVDKNRGLEYSGFGSIEWSIKENFSLSGGVRHSNYAHLGRDTVFTYNSLQSRSAGGIVDTTVYKKNDVINSFGGFEPRFSIRYSPLKSQSIKVGYNRMRQYIHQISNSAAPTPVDIWQVATNYIPPQIVDNYSVGYFVNVKDNTWELSAEYFYKKMKNLVEYKDFPTLFLNRHIETELVKAEGLAYGGELYARKMKGLWTGWISYTYSRSFVRTISSFNEDLVNRGEWYKANFDKPHSINIVVDKKIKNGGISWTASYSTGRPITAIESSFIVDNTVIPIYSDRNQYRIPDYFRIDMSVTIGSVLKKYDDSLVFSVYNLLSRENAYSIFYQTPTNFFVPKPYKLSVLGAAFPSITYNITLP